jgi:hypothetical protein
MYVMRKPNSISIVQLLALAVSGFRTPFVTRQPTKADGLYQMLEDHQGRRRAQAGGGRCQAWCMRVKWQKSEEYRDRVVNDMLAIASGGRR